MVSSYPPGKDQIYIAVIFTTFKVTEQEAKAALKPAEDSYPGEPAVHWFCQETSLEKEYANQAHVNPSEHRYHCENVFINNDADVAKIAENALTTIPTKETYAFYYPLSPWSQTPRKDMVFSCLTDHYLGLYTICKDMEHDMRCKTWAQDVIKDVKKHSSGSYIGDIDLQVRTTKFWGDEEGKKLMDIRCKWDPQGIICGYLDAEDKSGVSGLDNKLDNT